MKHRTEHSNSTSISCCEYDDELHKMTITFASGGSHEYDCDKSVYDALANAESPGKHFHSFIRRNYEGKKV